MIDASGNYHHIPVMLDEVIRYMNCQPGKVYVDCTIGGCGHSRAMLEKMLPDGLLIGIDQDQDAIEHARQVLKPYANQVRLFWKNYSSLPEILDQMQITGVDGILMDLGMSFHHLEGSGRGFSFNKDEPLDMRMDVRTPTTAEEIVNTLQVDELEHLFKTFGEERYSMRIAQRIVSERQRTPIRSSRQLAELIYRAVPQRETAASRIHPATRVFMAIRIAVNRELECLDDVMKHVPNWLNPGGRICVLSFHSLEDRIVKTWLKSHEKGCVCPSDLPLCICGKIGTMRRLTRKALKASSEEIAVNPLARSVRLRASEKI